MSATTAETNITRLLELWRSHKDPELPPLIARIGEASESASAKALRGKKLSQKEWLATLADASLVDRGAVLTSLAGATSGQVAERIRALEHLEPDPRIVDALHVLIETVPWTSTGARKVWTRVFALLAEVADPRTIAIARDFDPSKKPTFSATAGDWMVERLTKLAAAVADRPGALALGREDQAWVDELARGLGTEHARAPTVTADLFAAAMREPDDLDARTVLADALMEAGDPRGELIRVQLEREAAPDDRSLAAREKQLLKQHRDTLLGTLEPVVRKGNLVFARGFVVECEIDPMVHADVLTTALADEQIATIRRIRAPAAVVAAPGLRSLRDVEIIHAREQSLAPVFRCDRPLPFESLACRLEREQVPLLDGCECLPALRRLSIAGESADQRRALSTSLARAVEHLQLRHPELVRLRGLLALALADANRGRIVSADLNGEWESWSAELEL